MLSAKGDQSEPVGSLVEILEFTRFARVFKFNAASGYWEDSHKTILKKEISHEIKVSAIAQIKDRDYARPLERYTGEILLVWINYDRENKDKPHSCVIERA